MKKFGFGKKGAKDGDDSSRSSKNNSPAPSNSNPYASSNTGGSSNPYASQPTSDPYMNAGPPAITPYQQARAGMQGGLPSGPRGGGLPGGPRPGGYGSSNQSNYDYKAPSNSAPSYQEKDDYSNPPPTYSSDRYGSGGGYGGSRYGDTQSRGPSGYGGLGRTNSQDTTTTDDNRDALFGGARERVAAQPPAPRAPPQAGGYGDSSYGKSGISGSEGGYGAYGADRQLTAEEEEEEDVQATKQQIRFMKQEDVSSTRNALRIAAQAEETGRATLARLGAQSERIHNTEKNLDLAANHNRIAEERAKELKTLNRSMFAVHVSNPFTASNRREARDAEIIERHRLEREERDATREAAFASTSRMEDAFRTLQPGDPGYRAKTTSNKASLAERAKYQFEADSEDEEMENEIDGNLDALGVAATNLNLLARATGKEVDNQIVHIDRIIQKSDKVDDQIVMNRARLDRIK